MACAKPPESPSMKRPLQPDPNPTAPAQKRKVDRSLAMPTASIEPHNFQLDVKDLKPGLPANSWYLIVQVLGKIPFQTGSGFQAILGDVSGDTIAAFFFREVATKNDAAIRVGLRVKLSAASNLTYVRKADLKYGGRLQLVVGSDASLVVEQFRLGRLPHSGRVEIVGIISSVSEVVIASNGVPYRKILVVDETCIGGVDWFCWGSFATILPDTLERGTLVHIKMADIASSLGRRRHIRNGDAAFLQSAQYDERMKHLAQWAQEFYRL